MARNPGDVTEAELAVLEALWGGGPATIRAITEAVYPDGGTSRYATVQKLLERLEAKGFTARDRSGSVHRFEARVGRDDLIGARLRAVADALCEGSLTPLLSHLVKAEKLSKADLEALRAMIDEPGAGGPRKRGDG